MKFRTIVLSVALLVATAIGANATPALGDVVIPRHVCGGRLAGERAPWGTDCGTVTVSGKFNGTAWVLRVEFVPDP